MSLVTLGVVSFPFFFFFFQAEDGIRDADVTGVQTCALPISITVTMPFWWMLPNRARWSPGSWPAPSRKLNELTGRRQTYLCPRGSGTQRLHHHRRDRRAQLTLARPVLLRRRAVGMAGGAQERG